MLGLGHRVNVTRFQYHWTVGAFSMRDENDLISVHDEDIEHTSIRVFRPSNDTSEVMPTIIFYHGGGYFVGSADTIEPITYLMAKYTRYLVIYVEYRLIPEHKYPAAYEDSLKAAQYLIRNHKKYRIDLENLILMGDSAGGNLATSISQQLIETKMARPKMQVLIYPILQFFDFTLPSYRINLEKRILGNINHDNFKNFLHYFTGIEVDDSVFYNGHTSRYHKDSILAEYVNPGYLPIKLRNQNLKTINFMNDTSEKYSRLAEILLDKKVSPLLVDDEFLKKHTPNYTLLLTAEMDILRDDGFIYAERLKRVGKTIVHKHYDNMFHGVLGLLHGPLKFNEAHPLLKKIAQHVKEVISVK